ETGSTAGSGRSGRGSGGSSPPRYRRRRAAPARAPRSLRPALRACGCSSLFLAERFQAGGDLLERLGERLVEFSVRRLGGAAQRIAHALAGGARGVTDVVGGNPHRRPRDRGFGCRIRHSGFKRYVRRWRLVAWVTGPRRSSRLLGSPAPSAWPSSPSSGRTARPRPAGGTRCVGSSFCLRARRPVRYSSPWAAPARLIASRPPCTPPPSAAAPCWRSSRSPTLPRAAPWPPPAGRRRRSSFALGRGDRCRSRCSRLGGVQLHSAPVA